MGLTDRPPGVRARILKFGLGYFLIVFGFGFLFGTFRVLVLVPAVGERVAELLEMPLMLVVIVFAARWVVRAFPHAAKKLLLATGLLALALLAAAELTLAFALSGLSPLAYAASRDPVAGSAYLASLLVFALAPMLLGGRTRL